MSYVENRLKALSKAKVGQEMVGAQYNLRPRFLSYFVEQYCEWVGRNWREANIRREQEEREAQIQTSATTALSGN